MNTRESQYRVTVTWNFGAADLDTILGAIESIGEALPTYCFLPEHTPSRLEIDIEVDASDIAAAMRNALRIVLPQLFHARAPGQASKVFATDDESFIEREITFAGSTSSSSALSGQHDRSIPVNCEHLVREAIADPARRSDLGRAARDHLATGGALFADADAVADLALVDIRLVTGSGESEWLLTLESLESSYLAEETGA